MEIEKRIESLNKELNTLQNNLQRVDQNLNQLQQQRNLIMQKIIEVSGMIKERNLDLQEQKVKEANGTPSN